MRRLVWLEALDWGRFSGTERVYPGPPNQTRRSHSGVMVPDTLGRPPFGPLRAVFSCKVIKQDQRRLSAFMTFSYMVQRFRESPRVVEDIILRMSCFASTTQLGFRVSTSWNKLD